MLHRGLLETGVTSTMLVRERGGHDPAVRTFHAPMDWKSRVWRRFLRDRRAKKYRAFPEAAARGNDCLLSPAPSDFPEIPSQLPAGAVINLHWVAGCIDVPTFFAQAGTHRFVWTMHDMWPMTGACHYSGGCVRYAGSCGACPQILSKDENDVTRTGWLQKKSGYAALADDRMTIVTPSAWLGGEARRSALLGRFDVRVIPNGIDLQAFAPRPRDFARDTLGIPRDAFVLAFVADLVTTPRKGFPVLHAALERVQKRAGVWLISVGSGQPGVPEGFHAAHFGRISNDRLLSLFYSAADVFVLPTMEDNLPTTVLESLACGTSVIGSDVGGVPDMVRPGSTGFLFPVGDASALGAVLAEVMAQPASLAQLRPTCRAIAERDYSVTLQARRYRAVYEELAARPPIDGVAR